MSSENLQEIYELFGYGLIAGGLFSTFSFIVGYVINFLFSISR